MKFYSELSECILQILFISCASLIVLTELESKVLEPTIIDRHFALLIATFNRLVSSKKFKPLGASAPVLDVRE